MARVGNTALVLCSTGARCFSATLLECERERENFEKILNKKLNMYCGMISVQVKFCFVEEGALVEV